MIDFKKELNSEQLEVVANGDGYCLVLAGAGSGKTRVITYRVACLLEKGVKPENILLLTFTNKAAKEMLSRVEKIIGKKPDGLWGGTFHAIANRILRATAPLLGYQSNFSVLDQDDSETLLKSCVKELHFFDSKRFPSAGLIHSLYSFSRNAQITLTEAVDWKNSSFSRVAGDIEEATNLYQKKKKSSNVMDFDDLLVNWHEVLQKPTVLKKLADQFQYILIDEYQDTNRLQAAIVKLLASVHKNLLVVGDDAQSIYSFRAADINNILEFPKEFPKAKIFRLETNYRSTPNILNLANDVISQNKKQFKKKLKSHLAELAHPQVAVFDSPFAEANFIRQRVRELQEAGHALRDLAVLFRAAFHAQILEIELAKAGIPYEMRGGMRFFERAHIKDTISILRVVNNLKDEIAWFRVLEIFQGIGHETARMIITKARQSKDLPELFISGIRDGLNKNAQKGWDDFVSIAKILNEKKDQSAGDAVEGILKSVYADYLEDKYENAKDRLDDIKQLGWYAKGQKSLNHFLSDIALDESFGKKNARENQDRLVLSTIHQAKGLEWEAVFLINLASGCFPNERALGEPGGEEEERRLFYVGITRAKRHLYLTYPTTGQRMNYNRPSPFLEDIKDGLIDRKVSDGLGGFTDELPTIQIEEMTTPAPKKKKIDWRVKSFLKDIEDL